MEIKKEFRVIAKSSNTNSFGLHQLVVVAKDGEAYTLHASMYNAKEFGQPMYKTLIINDDNGNVEQGYFLGTEMPERIEDAPEEVIKEVWN